MSVFSSRSPSLKKCSAFAKATADKTDSFIFVASFVGSFVDKAPDKVIHLGFLHTNALFPIVEAGF
jgi:hypothetical protein